MYCIRRGGQTDGDRLEEARDKLQSEAPGVELRVLQLDTSDMTSVRRAADELNGYEEPIDIVINNAGVVRLAIFPSPYSLVLYRVALSARGTDRRGPSSPELTW